MIKYATLWLAVLMFCSIHVNSAPAQELRDTNDLRSNDYYSTACGPVACYAIMRWLNVEPVTFDEVANDCQWKSGKQVSCQNIIAALTKKGLLVRLVHLSPRTLAEVLQNHQPSAAILFVRKDSEDINHALAAIESTGKDFTVVGYPEYLDHLSEYQLSEIWDGTAIIISPPPPKLGRLRLFLICELLILTVLTIISVGLFTARGRRTQKNM